MGGGRWAVGDGRWARGRGGEGARVSLSVLFLTEWVRVRVRVRVRVS